MDLKIDADQVRDVFRRLPVQALHELANLIEGGAIDLQREIRKNSPVHDGSYRRSVTYEITRGGLNAEVGPTVRHAEWVEDGTDPHWTSVKEGTSLRKWADDKGINPWAVQRSIATKGIKAQHVVKNAYDDNHVKIQREIEQGFSRFVRRVDSGRF